MKDIITSLFIYKSQIYTSSLDGNISQTDIETKYISNEKVEFSLNKYFEEIIILDIKAYKNKFYIPMPDHLSLHGNIPAVDSGAFLFWQNQH